MTISATIQRGCPCLEWSGNNQGARGISATAAAKRWALGCGEVVAQPSNSTMIWKTTRTFIELEIKVVGTLDSWKNA
jgi:hypothetical protein